MSKTPLFTVDDGMVVTRLLSLAMQYASGFGSGHSMHRQVEELSEHATDLRARITEATQLPEPVESPMTDAESYRLLLPEFQRQAQEILALRSELASLRKGPYDVRSCRGHWHVTIGDHDIGTSTYDEAGAREAAERENVQWNAGREKLEEQVKLLRVTLQVAVESMWNHGMNKQARAAEAILKETE